MNPASSSNPVRAPRARWLDVLEVVAAEAYGEGAYVGQECFMSAGEILALGRAAGLTSGSQVLDLCCGSAGPALLLARATGCRVVGIDRDAEAARLAAERWDAAGMNGSGSFLAADVLRAPVRGPFDAVMLLESLMGFADKRSLFRTVHRLLRPGGTFLLTDETGLPLTVDEIDRMPGGEKVSFVSAEWLVSALGDAGFHVRSVEDCTEAHATVAERLALAFLRDSDEVKGWVGHERWRTMAVAHRQWALWFATGRLRNLQIVAERLP